MVSRFRNYVWNLSRKQFLNIWHFRNMFPIMSYFQKILSENNPFSEHIYQTRFCFRKRVSGNGVLSENIFETNSEHNSEGDKTNPKDIPQNYFLNPDNFYVYTHTDECICYLVIQNHGYVLKLAYCYCVPVLCKMFGNIVGRQCFFSRSLLASKTLVFFQLILNRILLVGETLLKKHRRPKTTENVAKYRNTVK